MILSWQVRTRAFRRCACWPAQQQERLVDQVGQVRTGETRRTAGDDRRLDVLADWHLAHVHLENLLATADVRQAYDHLPVEAARTQQRRIEHVGTVGSRDDDDAIVHLEAIHLHQQLVEGLLALVVPAAEAGTTMTTDRVDLVDEDDARRVLLGLLEHVADPAGADTDEHLDEIRTRDSEERHLRLTGNRFGQQRLTSTGRTDHQHATRNTAAETLEFTRVAEKLHQLMHFFLGLVATGDVSEWS